LAEAALRLIEEPSLRSRMGIAAQDFVRTHYDLSDSVDALENLYASILRTQSRSHQTEAPVA
jgi:glycosyltransferase involved in cell wall biosynthesis